MNKIGKILEKLIKDSKQSREWRSFVFCLAAIVVFTTTYALILPAITVEKDKTDSVGGLVVEEADPGSTVASAEASGDVHTVEAENKVSGKVVQVEAAGNTEAAEEVREPVNGEVQTVGDKKIMTLTGEKFDVVVSCDLYAGVSDGTVLSVCGIPDANVAKSYSDRISDELLKLFVDTKSTEILYRLVFTDTDFVEYTPEGYFDVEFIFHNNTVSSDGEIIYAPRFDGEKVYAAIYDYLTDEMILAEKNGDEYETPVISLDEYGFITSITLKGLDFYEYSDVITLVGGAVNEELKLAAEKAESKPEESSEKEKKAEGSKEGKGGTLSARGSDYTVTLVYSAEAEIPDKAVLEVTEIETGTSAYTKYLEQAKAAIGLDKEQVLPQEQARFFDIRIMAGGKEIQPAANVNVSIAYDTPVVESDPRTDSQVDVNAVHFGEKGAEVVEVGDADARSVEFEAESFSIYGVIYTVDFEYSVNGKMYQFSLPGGGFVSFTDLVEVLGITHDTNSDENEDKNESVIAENAEENGDNEGEEENGVYSDTNTPLTLGDVEVSEATRKFVADVASVEFSSPELVWVGKADEATTVGGLKEANGLQVQYSADLTEEQIAEINSSTVEAGDWALISVLPFTSEESLTVTMKNGDQFVVKVTDAQISKDYITVLGEKYKITVEYEDDAQIPDGAKLEVKEILPADEKYAEYYQKALEKAAGNEAAGGATLDNYARFFDIEIQVDGQKVEPKASVKVRIELADVPEEKNLAVVHFEESRSIDSTVPVLMDINAEKANDIWFETESFSVYGVITVPEAQPDPAVTDLDGKSFTISHDSRYVTTNITPIENNNNTNGFGKTTSVSQAATWFFEQPEGTSGNTYYIYTLVNDQKQYLNLTKNNNNTDRANASLSLTPQAFTVTNEGSSYRLSTQSNGTTYYLDEHNGNSGNAFAGWHGATNNGLLSLNFSSQPVMQDNGQYMTLVKYNDKYYIVNNDGSLTEVQYDDATKTVEVDDPMLWNVNQNNPNGHIWFNSRETGFEWRQIASDWYRRYLDPSVSGAITEENSSNVNVVYDYTNQDGSVANHIDRNGSRTRALESQTAVNIYDDPNDDKDTYKIYHGAWNAGQNYLGVELDENGVPARLVGQKNISDAAEFVFASPTAVKAPNYLTHTVDHIDVSIEGSANVSIPLAYGNYYGEHGDSEAPIKVVSANTKLELSKDQMVDPSQLKITSDDMKRATITAVRADTGENLDDAFYITGFSGNVHTSLSADQVRIEGSFLVADLRGTEYETIDGGRYSQNATYRNNVRTARLDNKVEYTVTVVKPLTYNLVDPDLGQLYDEDGNAITVTVDVAFSASFDYWDNGNECPAVHYASTDGEAAWRAGGVDSGNLSGMDFVLGGDAENPDSPLVALEITKVIMDEEGNRIELSSPVTNYFDIYEKRNATNNEKNGVTGLHVVDSLNHPEWESDDRDATIHNGYSYWRTKRLTVDDTGSAVVFDFNATDAMYYIVEKHDEESLPEMVTDRSGEEWTYVKTYIETEYVRRDDDAGSHDEYSNKILHPQAMHITEEFTRDNGTYASIPEVAGNFVKLNNEHKKEGFLEFYVYNIYKKVVSETDITLKKVDKDDVNSSNPNYLKGAAFTLSKYKTEAFQVKDTEWGNSGSKTLSDTKNPDGTYTLNGIFSFEGLTEGFYKIEEPTFPAGYVKLSSDPTFKIEVNSSNEMEITLINNPDNLLRLEDNNLSIVVGNTPGAALPSTGGPGTRLFTILGSILILGAGVLLWRRRRTI